MENHNSFLIRDQDGNEIRFSLYLDEAPETCRQFLAALPFSRNLFHARFSGKEIWTDDAPKLNMMQENASVFTSPGEIVIGPQDPQRVKTTGCIGIYYGEGKGVDAANIFGKVFDEDLPKLKSLGESIWKNGQLEILFLKNAKGE